MKQTTALILSLVILLSTAAFAISVSAQEDGADNIFTDVYSDDWFLPDLKIVYDAGLLQGKGNGVFDPDAFVTIAEISAVAARLHAFYAGTVPVFEKTSPWHKAYFDYCSEHGIFVPVHGDPSDQITREEFCAVIARILPEDVFSDTSTIVDGAIADVPADGKYAQDVYAICRSGILQCYHYQFFPALRINRYDLAAALARIINTSSRISYSIKSLYHLENWKPYDPNLGPSLANSAYWTAQYINIEYHQGDDLRIGPLCAYRYCISRPDSFMHSGVKEADNYYYGSTSYVPKKTLCLTADFLFGNGASKCICEELMSPFEYDGNTDMYAFPMNTDYWGQSYVYIVGVEIVIEGDISVVNVDIYYPLIYEERWYNYGFAKTTDPGTGRNYYQLVYVELDESRPILTDFHRDDVM